MNICRNCWEWHSLNEWCRLKETQTHPHDTCEKYRLRVRLLVRQKEIAKRIIDALEHYNKPEVSRAELERLGAFSSDKAATAWLAIRQIVTVGMHQGPLPVAKILEEAQHDYYGAGTDDMGMVVKGAIESCLDRGKAWATVTELTPKGFHWKRVYRKVNSLGPKRRKAVIGKTRTGKILKAFEYNLASLLKGLENENEG